LNEILVILNSPSAIRPKSKSGKTGHEKDRNEKKRGKNESGTSSKDSSSRQKDKKKVSWASTVFELLYDDSRQAN
jgi:hypothetical protein